jgi:hypothetical protein
VTTGKYEKPVETSEITKEATATPTSQRSNALFSLFSIIIFLFAVICIGAFIFYGIENAMNSTADKDESHIEIIDNLYRNTKYEFRIKFPKDWKIQNGDGPNILTRL